MYFILAKADFSQKNIGTLDSWSVSHNSPNGITWGAAPTSVDKNAALNFTATLDAANYEVTSSTVTMSGVDITLTALSKSGNIYTINISSVTGPVVVRFTTKNLSTGDTDDGGNDTPVTPPAGGGTNATYYFKDQATQGYLFGGYVESAASSRTTDFIDISHKPKIGYYGRMGYVASMTYHALEFYDSNKNYISDLSVNGTGSPMVKNIDLSDSKYANAYYVRASVAMGSYTTADLEKWYFIVGGSASDDAPSGNVTDYFPINEYIAADSHTTGNLGDMIAGNGGNAYRTDYVSIAGKSTVNYTGRMGTIGCNYAFYDSSKNVIPGLELVGDGTTVTKVIDLTDSKYANASYIVASISKGSISDADWQKSYFAIS